MPGESHGQRRLADYSPKGHKELDMTEHARARTHTHTHTPIYPETHIPALAISKLQDPPLLPAGTLASTASLEIFGTSFVAQVVKNLPAMQETQEVQV